MKNGHGPRGACPTHNTHGYEIASLAAIANCVTVLEQLCSQDFHAGDRQRFASPTKPRKPKNKPAASYAGGGPFKGYRAQA